MREHAMALGGTCSARFDAVRNLFAAKLESEEDLGPSVAVNVDDELVIADADRRLTIAYVMNKMVPCLIVSPIAAALVERVYGTVSR